MQHQHYLVALFIRRSHWSEILLKLKPDLHPNQNISMYFTENLLISIKKSKVNEYFFTEIYQNYVKYKQIPYKNKIVRLFYLLKVPCEEF